MKKAVNTPRLLSAMLVSPVLATAIASLLICLWMVIDQGALRTPAGDSLATSAPTILGYGVLIGAVLGWPTMLTGGLAAHTLLNWINRRKIWPYVAMSAAIGSFASGMCMHALFGDLGNGLVFVIGAVIGAITGAIFWAIRRPDRLF